MKPHLPREIQEVAEYQAALCRVFSNPQRILILWLLAERERTVTEIALAIGASLQNTSQHLHLMTFNHIVVSRRERHNVYYHIADSELMKNFQLLANRPKEKLMCFEDAIQISIF